MSRLALLMLATLLATGCFADGCYGPKVTFSDSGLFAALASPPPRVDG